MRMQNTSLVMGDILRAWVPFDEKPNVAGPKLRPVIFLGETIIDGTRHWVVAYGTTQFSANRESKAGTDFIVHAAREFGFVLNADTRFDFARLFALPATTAFFSPDRTVTTAPVAKLPAHYLTNAAQAMQAAKVGNTLRRLGVQL